MGLFPTDAGDGLEVTNTNGTTFKYDAADDKWYIINDLVISDVAYNEATWQANIDGATKNVIRDKFEADNANASRHHTATVAGDLNHQDLANRGTNDHHVPTVLYEDADADARIAASDHVNAAGAVSAMGAKADGNPLNHDIAVPRTNLTQIATRNHQDLNNRGESDHHVKAVPRTNLNQIATRNHTDLQGRTANDHHAESHAHGNIGSDGKLNGDLDGDGYGLVDCDRVHFRDNVNASIELEDHFTTDHRYHGITIDITNAIAFGLPVHIAGNNAVAQADADQIFTMPCIGVSVGTNKVLIFGVIYDVTYAFTQGEAVYVTSARILDDAIPTGVGDIVQVIGIAIDSDTLLVNPSLDWVKRK